MITLLSSKYVIAERLARSSSAPLSSWKVGDIVRYRTNATSPGITTRGGSMSKGLAVDNLTDGTTYLSTFNKVPGVMARAFRLEPQEVAE